MPRALCAKHRTGSISEYAPLPLLWYTTFLWIHQYVLVRILQLFWSQQFDAYRNTFSLPSLLIQQPSLLRLCLFHFHVCSSQSSGVSPSALTERTLSIQLLLLLRTQRQQLLELLVTELFVPREKRDSLAFVIYKTLLPLLGYQNKNSRAP